MIMELAVHKDIKVRDLSLLLKISMNDLTLNWYICIHVPDRAILLKEVSQNIFFAH